MQRGRRYSLVDHKKSNPYSDKNGNSLTGDYTLNSSSTDTETDNRAEVGMSVYQQTDAAGASTTTGNDLSGVYTTTSAGTTTVTSDDMVGSDVFVQINTTVSNLTQTGNGISGSFTSVDHPVLTTNVTQTGDDASGSFTLIENSHDNPTVTTTGNTISGQQTILTTNGSQTYDFTQTQSAYTLTGGGTKTYSSTETDSITTGVASSSETGTDSYNLGESGSAVDTQSLTGSDGYTATRTQNSLDGSFSIVTTGSGSNSYTVTQTGNTFAATVSLSQTGSTRYDQLEAYDNTADSASGNTGMADFSPVGLPVLVGRASVTAGTFSQIGNAQFEYCFPAGTEIRLADGGKLRIEQAVKGQIVRMVPEDEPTADPRAGEIVEVYHNAPARLLHVSVLGHTLRATPNHPIYVRDRGWIAAEHLQPGDRLRTDQREWIKVEAVRLSEEVEPVFNVQVKAGHTYFVLLPGSDVAVLVHNKSTLFITKTAKQLEAAGFTSDEAAQHVAEGHSIQPTLNGQLAALGLNPANVTSSTFESNGKSITKYTDGSKTVYALNIGWCAQTPAFRASMGIVGSQSWVRYGVMYFDSFKAYQDYNNNVLCTEVAAGACFIAVAPPIAEKALQGLTNGIRGATAPATPVRLNISAAAESGTVIEADPRSLRWSQTTAGRSLATEGGTKADVWRARMAAAKGWVGDPIDVVQTNDGLATLDHTRASVAIEQGITKIPMRVHAPDEPLPADMLTRPWDAKGTTAKTWGEALRLRGAGQTPPIGPTGSPTPPRLPKPQS
jgi:hypothetical protein